jgi:(p)ppGpp synthase/HD superfamily hydrolase
LKTDHTCRVNPSKNHAACIVRVFFRVIVSSRVVVIRLNDRLSRMRTAYS